VGNIEITARPWRAPPSGGTEAGWKRAPPGRPWRSVRCNSTAKAKPGPGRPRHFSAASLRNCWPQQTSELRQSGGTPCDVRTAL